LLVLFLLGHAILYTMFKFLSARRSELVIKLREYKELKEPVDALILGDSHAARGLDLSQMPGAVSLAYYGENNVMTYYRLKYCVETCKNTIKYVILPCDIVSFSKGFNRFRTNKFFYYSLIPFSELRQFENRPFNAYYEYLRSCLVPYAEWQYGLNLGVGERGKKGTLRFSGKSNEARQKNARHFIRDEMACTNKADDLFYSNALNYLERTLVYCKQNGIKPVFVKYPLTREVFDEIRVLLGEEGLNNRPAEMRLKQQKIPVLDFEKLLANRPDLFLDCHHLNVYGKAIFTPVFKRQLDSLMMQY